MTPSPFRPLHRLARAAYTLGWKLAAWLERRRTNPSPHKEPDSSDA